MNALLAQRVRHTMVWSLVVYSVLFPAWSPHAAALETNHTPARPAVSTVDLRPIFSNWGLDARRQEGRGTCSVITLVGAMEFALAYKQRHSARLSVEFLNWASNDAIGENEDGGFFSDLWKGYLKHGICPEADLPYQPKFDPKLKPPPAAMAHARELRSAELRLHWIKPWNVKTGLTPEEFAEIKCVLAGQWPVCGGFRWPKEERWQDNVLVMAPPEGVFDGHSIILVGFRDDLRQPGGGVFLVRNSGKGLPDAAMSYEYACAYMNDAVWIDHDAAGSQPTRLLNPASPAPAGRNRRVSSNQ